MRLVNSILLTSCLSRITVLTAIPYKPFQLIVLSLPSQSQPLTLSSDFRAYRIWAGSAPAKWISRLSFAFNG